MVESFQELDTLVQAFIVAGSTGVFLGFAVWIVRLLIIAFKKFF